MNSGVTRTICPDGNDQAEEGAMRPLIGHQRKIDRHSFRSTFCHVRQTFENWLAIENAQGAGLDLHSKTSSVCFAIPSSTKHSQSYPVVTNILVSKNSCLSIQPTKRWLPLRIATPVNEQRRGRCVKAGCNSCR